MTCDKNCPHLVSCQVFGNKTEKLFKCSAESMRVLIGWKTRNGFRHPVYGAVTLEKVNGKPVKSCKF
jgi:hypothetical protein